MTNHRSIIPLLDIRTGSSEIMRMRPNDIVVKFNPANPSASFLSRVLGITPPVPCGRIIYRLPTKL